MDTKLLQLSDKLKKLREKKERLDNEVKANNEEIEVTQNSMIEIMMSEELMSFNRDGVVFSLVNQQFPSAEPNKKIELWAAMKKQGYEDLFTINSRTLQGTLKEIITNNEDNIPDWLDGLIKMSEKIIIRVSKSK